MIATATMFWTAGYSEAHSDGEEEKIPLFAILLLMSFDLLMTYMIFVAPKGWLL